MITYEKVDGLFDDTDGLDDELPSPEVCLERSRTAELWATGEEFELEDETMRVDLFVFASQQATLADDAERALSMAQQAVAGAEKLNEWLIPDVRIRLYDCLVRAGREAEATDVERGLRQRLPDELESFDEMAQVLVDLGETTLAQRWCTMGIRFAEEHNLTDDSDYELLVFVRSEIRERAGLPKDELDLLAEEIVDSWDLRSPN